MNEKNFDTLLQIIEKLTDTQSHLTERVKTLEEKVKSLTKENAELNDRTFMLQRFG